MKKKSLISKPVTARSIQFEDMYEDLTRNWELKSKQLQDRRWRLMKRALKESSYNGRDY